MHRVVIALGANLGDRLATLREAAQRIDAIAPLVARSFVYETDPVGGPEQPAFLNAAVLATWTKEPADLLDELLAIERDLGRTRGVTDVRWGPRVIDLDMLWIDGVVIDTPKLVLPHPRVHERAFAMAPLLDVVPDARDPRTGRAYVVPAGVVRQTDLVLA